MVPAPSRQTREHQYKSVARHPSLLLFRHHRASEVGKREKAKFHLREVWWWPFIAATPSGAFEKRLARRVSSGELELRSRGRFERVSLSLERLLLLSA